MKQDEKIIDDVINHHFNSAIITEEQILRRAAFLRKAFTVDELLRRTSLKSKRKAINCSSRMTRATPKIGLWLFSVRCRERKSRGPYDVRFKILKGQRYRDMRRRDIKVSCNCNFWKFNGPDSNSLSRNYNERQYSNGALPNVRDRGRRHLICKHIAVSIPIFGRFIVPAEYK